MARVLLFGRLAEAAGWRERDVETLCGPLSALKASLAAEQPELAAALAGPGVRAAVDQELVTGDPDLAGVREVAFLPSMSGG